jgi:hypothetical protein
MSKSTWLKLAVLVFALFFRGETKAAAEPART